MRHSLGTLLVSVSAAIVAAAAAVLAVEHPDTFSRVALAAAFVSSGVSASSFGVRLGWLWAPHCALVAVGSLVASWAMLHLAWSDWPWFADAAWIVPTLNSAVTVTVAGWAALAWRLLVVTR